MNEKLVPAVILVFWVLCMLPSEFTALFWAFPAGFAGGQALIKLLD